MGRTIDEAIAHAREVAKDNRSICTVTDKGCDKFSKCLQCAEEHEQLAEWLEELKEYKATNYPKCSECAGCTQWNCDCANVRDKAIDDFEERLKRYVDCGHLCSPTEVRWSDLSIVEMVDCIAQQLKEGAVDGNSTTDN